MFLVRKYLNFGWLIVKKINKRKVCKKNIKIDNIEVVFSLYYFNIFPSFLLLRLSKSFSLLYYCFFFLIKNYLLLLFILVKFKKKGLIFFSHQFK